MILYLDANALVKLSPQEGLHQRVRDRGPELPFHAVDPDVDPPDLRDQLPLQRIDLRREPGLPIRQRLPITATKKGPSGPGCPPSHRRLSPGMWGARRIWAARAWARGWIDAREARLRRQKASWKKIVHICETFLPS
jgi:hypothetical protein